MSEVKTTFEAWCIVELFGHAKIAGKCTEQNVAGINMLRVDVPETKTQPAFTRLFGGSAIYSINPVDESTARLAANDLQAAPITIWQGSVFTDKFLKANPALPSSDNQDDLPY